METAGIEPAIISCNLLIYITLIFDLRILGRKWGSFDAFTLSHKISPYERGDLLIDCPSSHRHRGMSQIYAPKYSSISARKIAAIVGWKISPISREILRMSGGRQNFILGITQM